MTERTKRLSRRNFLLTLGAGGAATAAAIVAKNPTPSKPSRSGQGKRATRGYELSEHIRHYYRTTLI
jgi:hypothetical protein